MAGHRRGSYPEAGGADEPGDDDLTDQLVDAQYRAALRLDRAAVFLTGFAWFSLVICILASAIVSIAIAVAGASIGWVIGSLAIGLAVSALVFVPAYFTPTWARAYAAHLLLDSQLRWDDLP